MGPSAESPVPPEGVVSLDALLSPMHDGWVEEIRRFLVPATTPNAPFWDRWSAVRYLNDQFLAHFTMQRTLLAELRPLIQPHHLDGIEAGTERVARLRLSLDRIGRRRGTAAEFALMADELLAALELWCAEIESAVRHVDAEHLPEDGARILALLESVMRPVG
jgi:hypothetical protein